MNELQVLFPQDITDANYTYSNIAEPDVSMGEVVWVSGDNSAIGTRRIRTQTHRIYERISAGVSTTAPEDDPVIWADAAPTNKWAWSDPYSDTAIESSVPIVFSATPGTTTAMTFQGLVGDAITVVVKDAPGGAVLFTDSFSLYDYPGVDLYWEYFFYFPLQLDSIVITDIYPEPACEITVTIGLIGTHFECGRANFGNLEPLGLPEYGISAKPRSFRKIKTDDFGNVTVIPGRTAVDLSGSCVLEDGNGKANAAFDLIKRLQNKPVSVIPSSLEKYRHLVNFGFIDADITAEGPNHSKITLKMEGIT